VGWRHTIVTQAHTIVVLGDSLAISPSRELNFAAELQTRLNATHPGWTVINQGVRGDTTSGGVRRVDYALAGNPRILILELGANDGLRGVDVQTIGRNLETLIQRAQTRGIQVLLCGMKTPPLRGLTYTRAFHEIYPGLAARYGLPLVPFLLEGVAFRTEFNYDGVHPNAAGAKMVSENVWPYLERVVAGLTVRL
jgi:acyl-CoA thioesterase I